MSGVELSVKSGKALVYFFSDLAFNMYGFNITFAYDKCPGSCSSNGECRHGVCHCFDGYRGTACDRLVCRHNDTGQPGAEACSYSGVCQPDLKCQCNKRYHGRFQKPAASIPLFQTLISRNPIFSSFLQHFC